jgi:prepilin-type N-terminal cleavage/methylation domain-containing protein
MLIKRSNKNGFSLLELLLAIGILGIIAVFALSISHSTKNLAKTNDTKNRMREIKRAALDYYRGHRDLPAPARSIGSMLGADTFTISSLSTLFTVPERILPAYQWMVRMLPES